MLWCFMRSRNVFLCESYFISILFFELPFFSLRSSLSHFSFLVWLCRLRYACIAPSQTWRVCGSWLNHFHLGMCIFPSLPLSLYRISFIFSIFAFAFFFLHFSLGSVSSSLQKCTNFSFYSHWHHAYDTNTHTLSLPSHTHNIYAQRCHRAWTHFRSRTILSEAKINVQRNDNIYRFGSFLARIYCKWHDTNIIYASVSKRIETLINICFTFSRRMRLRTKMRRPTPRTAREYNLYSSGWCALINSHRYNWELITGQWFDHATASHMNRNQNFAKPMRVWIAFAMCAIRHEWYAVKHTHARTHTDAYGYVYCVCTCTSTSDVIVFRQSSSSVPGDKQNVFVRFVHHQTEVQLSLISFGVGQKTLQIFRFKRNCISTRCYLCLSLPLSSPSA